MEKTRKIAIASNCGGSGRTTTAVNLALSLAIEGRRVLLVDMTEQGRVGQVADYFGFDEDLIPFDFYDFTFSSENPDRGREMIYRVRENLDLIRGGHRLLNLELDIYSVKHKCKTENNNSAIYKVFSNILEGIENDFDFIIFDTSAYWGLLTINAMMYVDEVIIPVNLEHDGYHHLLDYIAINLDQIQRRRSSQLRLSHILPICFDRRTGSSMSRYHSLQWLFQKTILERTKFTGDYTDTIISRPISYNAQLNECYANVEDIFWHHRDNGIVRDYRTFTQTLLDKDTVQIPQTKQPVYA